MSMTRSPDHPMARFRIGRLILRIPCGRLIDSFSARLAAIHNLDSPAPMKMKVYYHDNCFDGLASAAVFSNFFRHGVRSDAEIEYEGLAHRAGQLFIDVKFDGDENAIVDFK